MSAPGILAWLRSRRDPSVCVPLPANATLRVGRGPEADLVLDNKRISRVHAILLTVGEVLLLVDAGSTNGSFVNGQRVTRHELAAGDVVGFDRDEFVVEYARAQTRRETLLGARTEVLPPPRKRGGDPPHSSQTS